MTGFRRPVSPNEWLYLAGADLAPPFAIQLAVEGSGAVSVSALRRAVARAGDACPGSRLVREGRVWVDSGVAPPVRVGRFDACAPLGATCEVLHAGSTLVFRAFHGVMDGRGALLWAAEVFRALRGEAASGAASPVSDYELLDRLGAVGQRGTVPLRRWRVTPGLGGDRPARRAGVARRTPESRRPGTWVRRTVDGNHPGLVARIAAVLSVEAPARFMIPVDLRRHAPSLASTANLSLPIFLDGDAGEQWEQWHQRLLRALSDRQELTAGLTEQAAYRLPLPALRPLLAAADGVSRRARLYGCTALLSHLGRIDLDAFSSPGFDATTVYSVPVHAPFAPVSIVATETAGRTELTASGSNEELLDRVCEALSPASHRAALSGTAEATVVFRAMARKTAVASPGTVAEAFRQQAAATPEAVALTGPEGEVTYAELDRRSDAVAAAVAGQAAEGPLAGRPLAGGPLAGQAADGPLAGGPLTGGPLAAEPPARQAVVGLLADRSVGAIAGLLGVLKAGAAYLPLDPAYPDVRIRALLEDAGATVCLASRRHAPRVPGALILEHLPPAEAPAVEVEPDDLAYVIYTSGSTGVPKGVQVSHRNLLAYGAWARELYRVDAGTRFALFTSLAFDLTGTAILLPLLAGGSIALVPDEVGPATLRHVLHGSGANTLKLTPAHLDLIGMLDLTAQGFRALVVGGEQLSTAVAARAQEAFGPACRIVNEYGPTEATIGCVVHVFDGSGDTAVPIGAPVPGTTVALLDAERRHVAPGEVGELYLAGAQLARGYLGRPDLDRERFVRLADGTRAYRSGDLARVLPSGALEYLGRADSQIKIRGHRVEPGEVEAALVSHPGVVRATVVGRARPGSRDTVLCAYVVGACSEDELRRYLAERLPRHLVPSYLCPVDALPLTANGKVDVRALPDPFAAGYPAAYLAKLDPVEAEIARIWSRILAVDVAAIGPESDFHALGGDSLSMIEMIVAVGRTVVGPHSEAAFQDELAALVGDPTLAKVAAAARQPV